MSALDELLEGVPESRKEQLRRWIDDVIENAKNPARAALLGFVIDCHGQRQEQLSPRAVEQILDRLKQYGLKVVSE